MSNKIDEEPYETENIKIFSHEAHPKKFKHEKSNFKIKEDL